MSWKNKYDKLMIQVDKNEAELEEFNRKYRELEKKFRAALELIQKLEPK